MDTQILDEYAFREHQVPTNSFFTRYFFTNLHKKRAINICLIFLKLAWLYMLFTLNICCQFNALVYLKLRVYDFCFHFFLVKQSRKNQGTIHKDLMNQIIHITLQGSVLSSLHVITTHSLLIELKESYLLSKKILTSTK